MNLLHAGINVKQLHKTQPLALRFDGLISTWLQ